MVNAETRPLQNFFGEKILGGRKI